jgi:hypothetical protein
LELRKQSISSEVNSHRCFRSPTKIDGAFLHPKGRRGWLEQRGSASGAGRGRAEVPVLVGGIVVIEAVIDEHGNVTGMRVISGHPMLIPSALTGVSKRRYESTVLDGEPTPVDLRVQITFSFL